ncbi:MAG: hypothetical protein NZU63_10880 [Gemmataceae bacterium]|nr:hypothetical protein [Gemmataceae bacterium]MDW8244669.1 hypothetical protein [Thermogemmata sp.]
MISAPLRQLLVTVLIKRLARLFPLWLASATLDLLAPGSLSGTSL